MVLEIIAKTAQGGRVFYRNVLFAVLVCRLLRLPAHFLKWAHLAPLAWLHCLAESIEWSIAWLASKRSLLLHREIKWILHWHVCHGAFTGKLHCTALRAFMAAHWPRGLTSTSRLLRRYGVTPFPKPCSPLPCHHHSPSM